MPFVCVTQNTQPKKNNNTTKIKMSVILPHAYIFFVVHSIRVSEERLHEQSKQQLKSKWKNFFLKKNLVPGLYFLIFVCMFCVLHWGLNSIYFFVEVVYFVSRFSHFLVLSFFLRFFAVFISYCSNLCVCFYFLTKSRVWLWFIFLSPFDILGFAVCLLFKRFFCFLLFKIQIAWQIICYLSRVSF